MPTIYEQCGKDDEAMQLVKQVIEKWHPDAKEARVTVDVLMASNDEDSAVKLNGYPCAAKIRVVPYKDRVKGNADTEIIVDAEWWKEHHAKERLALIDHEVTHIEVRRDNKGNVKRDDIGRPKLKLRLHDHQIGIFMECVRRHKDASPDQQLAQKFIQGEDGQLIMEFANKG